MAKTSIRRHHANRLLNKWNKFVKHSTLSQEVKFGEIYKQDPIDCGNPLCILCSGYKIFDNKRRASLRKEERESFKEFI
jgi:hypothetical protein